MKQYRLILALFRIAARAFRGVFRLMSLVLLCDILLNENRLGVLSFRRWNDVLEVVSLIRDGGSA